jgi:hypothetical protein
MNAHAQIAAPNLLQEGLEEDLAAAVGEDLATSIAPLPDLDRHAGFHRRAAAAYERRAGASRAAGKADLEALKRQRQEMKTRHAAELAALDDRETACRDTVAADVANYRRLARASRAALAELEAD